MRKFIFTAVIVLGLAAIGTMITGPASALTARTQGADTGRAHSTLVASRAQSILV